MTYPNDCTLPAEFLEQPNQQRPNGYLVIAAIIIPFVLVSVYVDYLAYSG